ncbi:hypothetical protein diail_2067 [Diaporthe ilicicola]|nr:hypothetical protein diail_2067 [Diaporthe ilicicola]
MAGTGRTFDDETAGTAALLLKKLNKGPKPQGNTPEPVLVKLTVPPTNRDQVNRDQVKAIHLEQEKVVHLEKEKAVHLEQGLPTNREQGKVVHLEQETMTKKERGSAIVRPAMISPEPIWCLTVDAPHSPQALSRPIVTWTVGGSRVAAVIAPFISAATYSSYLYAFLRRSLNETLPAILSPIDPAGIAKLNVSADKLRTEMLSDADARWRHLQEIDEYIFTDIESAWFFQRGDWDLILRLFPRRAVYYASLWAGVPSPEPPMRTARRRVSELQAFLEHGVAANDALLWKAIATRLTYLQRMESAVQKYNVMLRRDGRADQPRDANREQRDAEAVTKVIQDLLHRAAENSTAADQQFTREPDVFKAMVWELKQKKASLSPNNAVFEGSWGLVFENGARALEVLVRLEELTGALRWLLADVEEPKGKLG